MEILTARQIQQKVQRLAIEILEHNYDEQEIILAGINNNGMRFAGLLHDRIVQHSDKRIRLSNIRINPADPLSRDIEIDLPLSELHDKAIIVIDDVANTGRTLFYACTPLLRVLPRKVEIGVLVDRKHKSFPIRVDYVGLALATTLKNDIEVVIDDPAQAVVNLS